MLGMVLFYLWLSWRGSWFWRDETFSWIGHAILTGIIRLETGELVIVTSAVLVRYSLYLEFCLVKKLDLTIGGTDTAWPDNRKSCLTAWVRKLWVCWCDVLYDKSDFSFSLLDETWFQPNYGRGWWGGGRGHTSTTNSSSTWQDKVYSKYLHWSWCNGSVCFCPVTSYIYAVCFWIWQ